MYPSPYPPFAAPFAPVLDPRAALRRGVGGLGTAVSVLLGLDAAVLLAQTVGFAWRFVLISRYNHDPASVPYHAAAASDAYITGMSWTHAAVVLATAVVFLCWFSAARANADVYAATTVPTGPPAYPGALPSHPAPALSRGWAVGSWFVPLANLVLPFLAARDAYKGTMLGRAARPESGGRVTAVWWTLLLLALATSTAARTVAQGHSSLVDRTGLPDLQTSAALSCAGDLVLIAAAVALVWYVQKISGIQRRRNAELGPPVPAGFAPPFPYPYPDTTPMPMPAPGLPQSLIQLPSGGPGQAPVVVGADLPVQGPLPIPVPEYQPVTTPAAAEPASGEPAKVEPASAEPAAPEAADAEPAADSGPEPADAPVSQPDTEPQAEADTEPQAESRPASGGTAPATPATGPAADGAPDAR